METEVKQAYLKYFDSYIQRKLDDMLKAFSADFNMIGTGIDEFSVIIQHSLELFKREFSQAPDPFTYQFKVLRLTHYQRFSIRNGLVDMKFLLPTAS
jgi:hypothetical protein